MKIATCDFCCEDIDHKDTLLVDHKLTYHGECYLHLIKGFPKLIKEFIMNQYYCPCGHRIHPTDRTVVDEKIIYHFTCFYNMEDKDETPINSDNRNEHGYPMPSPNQT